jgi:hypothetical protein
MGWGWCNVILIGPPNIYLGPQSYFPGAGAVTNVECVWSTHRLWRRWTCANTVLYAARYQSRATAISRPLRYM